ncbi:hypothetical protein NL676_024831 [Syzygium grande]|nr:hypothetical protein NL676_024831 [Syzygium grande]
MKLRLLHKVALALLVLSHYEVAEGTKKPAKTTYIIHMDKSNMPETFADHLEWYDSSLKSVSDKADMLYTYNSVLHGFSARLTAEEAELLGKQPGILSVMPEVRYELHTTRTPEFLGLGKSEVVYPKSNLASEVIVGVLDTGVWPELKSYDDAGLGERPSTWKGTCEVGKNFNSSSCNKKLVGARFFSKGYEAAFGPIDESVESKSPRDDDGHGTHTSTTAAGSAVPEASLFGFASGTARGMATQARVATYKVCWLGGCFGSDIMAAMDKAVEDGNASNSSSGELCFTGSLVANKVAGKIVVCDRGGNSRPQKSMVVKNAGGVGMILANTEYYGEELVADAHLLPSAAVGQKAGIEIKKYIFSDPSPTATIASGGTELEVQPSPVVASFSSRGPNPLNPQILKPDLIAPGVNILAGWTGAVGPTGLDSDKRRVNFNIISGTSMSCPHVSGLAALLKAAHQEWSPAAIRSALMTTAYTKYKNGETIEDVATGSSSTPFDYGAGHVDPVAALDPGLVYDATVDDYLRFFCALNYTSDLIKRSTNRDYTCDSSKKYNVEDLNYPSFAVPMETASSKAGGAGASSTVKYTRTLTNVGSPGTYKVSVSSQIPSVKILVEPESLTFSTMGEKESYTVTFIAGSMPSGTTSFASLKWSDGKHSVGSPIAISWT